MRTPVSPRPTESSASAGVDRPQQRAYDERYFRASQDDFPECGKRDRQLSDFAAKLNAAASVPVNQPLPRSGGDGFVMDYEEYVVQKGATLTAIAKAYGVTVDSIRRANNMKSDMLRVGEKLKIPRK